jgi:hypothetical protein
LIASGILVPNSSAQDAQIPDWVRNVADWWANDEISENEFLSGIEYLINNNIILIPFTPCSISHTDSSDNMVPDWFKNNAKWWSEDLIEDTEFINGIEYLIKKQIVSIDNKKIVGKVPLEDITFSPSWSVDKSNLGFVSSSFFEVYGVPGNCYFSSSGANPIWNSLVIGLNPNKLDMYNEVAVWNDPQKTVVVYPYFTYLAYTEPGFYTYYRGDCDSCTTTKFTPSSLMSNEYVTSGIGHQALTLLGYHSITDVDIDKNPSILQQFDKVIILHNEYVTRTIFDAITNHPNVIYLYPNALYAEIEVNYMDETITLIRGHNYPEPEITNGFDWEFDNTHPYEFDSLCLDMEIYPIENGRMITCYPENLFLKNTEQLFNLLKFIKNL